MSIPFAQVVMNCFYLFPRRFADRSSCAGRVNRCSLALIAVLLATTTIAERVQGQLSSRGEVSTRDARADSVAVADALRRFLTAFEHLDWPQFRAAFSDSATIFHPAAEMAERVTGPQGIDTTFRAVFASIRKHATGGPPYHRLDAADLRIQPLSPGVVLVTFHLRNAERLARRTIIFRKEGTSWYIFHLHASNSPRP